VAAAAPPPEPCAYPAGLLEEISKKYHDARLVSLQDLDDYNRRLYKKGHGTRCPGLVRVDFYGDGKSTWALALISKEGSKQKVEQVVAHHVAAGWETRSLDATDDTPVVWREGPGKYEDIYGQKKLLATFRRKIGRSE